MTTEELKRLMAEATPGEWTRSRGHVLIDARTQICCGNLRGEECCGDPDMEGGFVPIVQHAEECDAALIAAMHNALPELIAKVEAYDKIMALPVLRMNNPLPNGKSPLVEAAFVSGYYSDQAVRIVPVEDGEQIPMHNWPSEPPHCPTCDCGTAGENGEGR